MATTNPPIERTGTSVASGPANVTVNPKANTAWAIGATLGDVASLAQKNVFLSGEDRSLSLIAGESLFVFGSGDIAVTITVTS